MSQRINFDEITKSLQEHGVKSGNRTSDKQLGRIIELLVSLRNPTDELLSSISLKDIDNAMSEMEQWPLFADESGENLLLNPSNSFDVFLSNEDAFLTLWHSRDRYSKDSEDIFI